MSIEFLEREGQLRRMEKALGLADQGRGRIVAIAGEAGTGKTTLVNRFIECSAPARTCIAVHVKI